MKKRIICLILSCLLLAACGSKNDWDSKMGNLDKPQGNEVSATIVTGGIKYLFSEIEYKEATTYIEYLKLEGYTIEPIYNLSKTTLLYNAKNSDGYDLEFMYNIDAKVATITYTSKMSTSTKIVETSSDKLINTIDWDSSKMGELQAPEGFQFDQEIQSTYGWTVYFSKASVEEVNEFILNTTNQGYTLDISKEDSDGYYIYYTAYKDNNSHNIELYIMYNIEAEGGYITVSK